MNSLTKLSGTFVTSVALIGCSGDNPNDIRLMKCYDQTNILPQEIIELEKSIKTKIETICGTKYVVDGFHPMSWNTPVNTTILVTKDGKLFTLTKNVETFLRPIPKTPPDTSTGKYQIKP